MRLCHHWARHQMNLRSHIPACRTMPIDFHQQCSHFSSQQLRNTFACGFMLLTNQTPTLASSKKLWARERYTVVALARAQTLPGDHTGMHDLAWLARVPTGREGWGECHRVSVCCKQTCHPTTMECLQKLPQRNALDRALPLFGTVGIQMTSARYISCHGPVMTRSAWTEQQ